MGHVNYHQGPYQLIKIIHKQQNAASNELNGHPLHAFSHAVGDWTRVDPAYLSVLPFTRGT